MIRTAFALALLCLLLFVATAFFVTKSLYDQSASLELRVGGTEQKLADAKQTSDDLDKRLGDAKATVKAVSDELAKIMKEVDQLGKDTRQVEDVLRKRTAIAATGTRVFLGRISGVVECWEIKAAVGKGELVWKSTKTAGPVDAIVVSGKILFAHTTEEKLLTFDADTGRYISIIDMK